MSFSFVIMRPLCGGDGEPKGGLHGRKDSMKAGFRQEAFRRSASSRCEAKAAVSAFGHISAFFFNAEVPAFVSRHPAGWAGPVYGLIWWLRGADGDDLRIRNRRRKARQDRFCGAAEEGRGGGVRGNRRGGFREG